MSDYSNLESSVFNKGHIEVSHNHQIYFTQFGNPDGIKILFIHGGPGIGCNDFDLRFFDPEKFNVLFFDQRGAGQSLPSRSIENNTTPLLLEDMAFLLNHFNIMRTHVFAGSWGSTLAMLFAIKHPEKIESMILRGYFPATKKAKDFFENGSAAKFFPKEWEQIERLVPNNKTQNRAEYYLSQLNSSNPEIRNKYAYELIYYNVATAKIGITKEEIQYIMSKGDLVGKALIQCHYSAHNFFIEDDFILNNIDQVVDIPITIIHGRYDMICPPIYAYELHKQLNNSKLYIVNGGHLTSEPEIEKLLIQSLDFINA